MTKYITWGGMLAAGICIAAPAHAARSNCGNVVICNTEGTVKDSTVIPNPNDFTTRGDLFSSAYRAYDLRGGAQEISFGFNVNFGFGLVGSAFLNKNGILSFGAPIAAGQFATASTLADLSGDATATRGILGNLGAPVIAPYFGQLLQDDSAGETRLVPGQVVVQYGQADPYADDVSAAGLPSYNPAELRDAVRITWYGLVAGNTATVIDGDAATGERRVYAQLLISSDLDGLSNFEFRYGPPGSPGQDDYGSVAGFALGNTVLEFNGPYRQGIPTFFEFNDGEYIGQGGTRVTPGVPEPATWAQLILGFGAAGYALRRRRVRVALAAA